MRTTNISINMHLRLRIILWGQRHNKQEVSVRDIVTARIIGTAWEAKLVFRSMAIDGYGTYIINPRGSRLLRLPPMEQGKLPPPLPNGKELLLC